jgi:hypothetical protein
MVVIGQVVFHLKASLAGARAAFGRTPYNQPCFLNYSFSPEHPPANVSLLVRNPGLNVEVLLSPRGWHLEVFLVGCGTFLRIILRIGERIWPPRVEHISAQQTIIILVPGLVSSTLFKGLLDVLPEFRSQFKIGQDFRSILFIRTFSI